MKKKNFILFIIIFIISNTAFSQARYTRTNKNTLKKKNIKLPLNLKWGMKPKTVIKVLKINKLYFANSSWAKFIKKDFRYWFYFAGKNKKLKQISIYFKTNKAFVIFMQNFKNKYQELRIKANIYKDSKTKVGIEATIKPQVIFLHHN